MPTRRKGFTLVELLIVVAIIGIIVAISLLNYVNAIQRARQKRSMADMRGIGVALDSYQIDWNAFPPAAANTLPPGVPLPTKTLGKTYLYVMPTYIQSMPLVDGWNSWFLYGTNPPQTDFVIVSTGSDGKPEGSPSFAPTTSFTNDIIYSDGTFLQYPEGAQVQ